MEIFNKILHSYAMYCCTKIVEILKCSFQKKVMALCLRVQYFLANPVASKKELSFFTSSLKLLILFW